MKARILVSEVVDEAGLEFLRLNGLEIFRGRGISKDELIEDLQGCQGMILRVAKLDRDVLSRCPELKVIGKHGVGVDSIDLDYCKEHGIIVVNTPEANGLSVAEHAMTLMLSCAKQIPYKVSAYKAGDYSVRDALLGNEVSGKTLGLLGMGRIGAMVGRMARNGFGMRVIAYDPFLPVERTPEGFGRVQDRDEVFRNSDFVSIHMPATKETFHSVGEREFALMKPAAYLINTARGTVVDEDALIKALKSGQIAGAGLDVTDPEPARTDNPLLRMQNVVMTPHCAASTLDAMRHMSLDVAKGIIEVFKGVRPTWRVC